MTDEFVPDGEAVGDGVEAPIVEPTPAEATGPDYEALVAERTFDLQRLQAEYVNYKRRVDRDRDLARKRGIESVLADLLPVLDGIEAARLHGDLNGGAQLLADELEKVTTKNGLTAYGAKGDPFDPQLHDALMHLPTSGVPADTCAEIIQQGYTLDGRVLRPARVAVAIATDDTTQDDTD